MKSLIIKLHNFLATLPFTKYVNVALRRVVNNPSLCFCGKIIQTTRQEISPTMQYVQNRTCSVDCHNNWILGDYSDKKPVGNGWMTIIREAHNKLKKIDPHYEIVQLKEKFAVLRYYVERKQLVYPSIQLTRKEISALEYAAYSLERQSRKCDDERAKNDLKNHSEILKNLSMRAGELGSKIIDDVEHQSSTICEECGKTNALMQSNQYWARTLCDSCNKTWQEKNISL